MAATLVGYCRCSTDAQDLTAQRQRLRELGVTEDRIYLDGDDLLDPAREGKGAAAESSTYVDHEVTSPERGPGD